MTRTSTKPSCRIVKQALRVIQGSWSKSMIMIKKMAKAQFWHDTHPPLFPTTQDSLPVASQALPGGLFHAHWVRLASFCLSLSPLPGLSWRDVIVILLAIGSVERDGCYAVEVLFSF